MRSSPSRSYSMPVLGRVEACELADVGARHEGLAAGSAQHEHAHRVVGVHLVARPGSSRSYMFHVIALRAAGRLNVRVTMGPSRSTRTSSALRSRSPM